MSRYYDKFGEAEFHVKKMEECFRSGDSDYLHYFNGFLSSAQSVIFCLNKEFTGRPLYEGWKNKRSTRLPAIAKMFKELRNVSEKEAPVKNSSVVIGFDFGAAGITIPAHATVTGPWIDTKKFHPTSYKSTITTKEGVKTEVEPQVNHDFSVAVESKKKVYRLDSVVSDSRNYINALKEEISKTEEKFLKDDKNK